MGNMTRIKPSHYEVYPIYICTCGAEWQQTVEETVFPAGILCHCGAKLKLATIEDLQVKASFKTDSEPASQPPENCGQKNDIYEDVISALVSRGFKKREAKNLIDKYYVEGVTPEDLVGEILRGR